jgi:hypothetical protein
MAFDTICKVPNMHDPTNTYSRRVVHIGVNWNGGSPQFCGGINTIGNKCRQGWVRNNTIACGIIRVKKGYDGTGSFLVDPSMTRIGPCANIFVVGTRIFRILKANV